MEIFSTTVAFFIMAIVFNLAFLLTLSLILEVFRAIRNLVKLIGSFFILLLSIKQKTGDCNGNKCIIYNKRYDD
ncbi:hypothetical protein [Pantoea agglomerans]|uniref:hypothetical protein n=1 Tax=Enterobacter agglomerans TaxID=549 RepID=UPI003C7BE7C5